MYHQLMHDHKLSGAELTWQLHVEQVDSVPLPGTFDMARVERVTAGVGKCSVCGLEKAAWIDRQAGVKLCEHCYSREVRKHACAGCNA